MAAPSEGTRASTSWDNLAEVVRSYIAIFVVTFSLLFILIAWAVRGIGDAERIATFLAGILGLVIGYYFGKEGVDQARAEAEKADREAGQAAQLRAIAEEVASDADDDLRRRAEAQREKIQEYVALLDAAEKDPNRKVKDLLEEFYGDED